MEIKGEYLRWRQAEREADVAAGKGVAEEIVTHIVQEHGSGTENKKPVGRTTTGNEDIRMDVQVVQQEAAPAATASHARYADKGISAATGAGEHFRFEAPLLSGEFAVTRFVYGMGENRSPLSGMFFRQLFFRVEIKRDPTYYLYKGVLPMLLVFCVSLIGTVGLNSKDFAGDKLSGLLAAILTLFAIQWTIADRLPRLPFLTELDRVSMSCGTGLLLLVLGVAVSHQVALNFDDEADPDSESDSRTIAGTSATNSPATTSTTSIKSSSASERLLAPSSLISFGCGAVSLLWVGLGLLRSWRAAVRARRSSGSTTTSAATSAGDRAGESSRHTQTGPSDVVPRTLEDVDQVQADYVVNANCKSDRWKKPPFMQGKLVRALKYDVVLPGIGPITFLSRPLALYEATSEEDFERKVGREIELEEFDPAGKIMGIEW
ncbi:unnamed protein product [Amoebophrya sp. A120]|nr:unnamed protein product [Amoebophrya sp. A120]|eukprot:GSA120T00005900001.1